MNTIKLFLYNFRLSLFKEYREKKLVKIIFEEIICITGKNLKKNISILDFGSGKKPVIINKLIKELNQYYKKKLFEAECYDFYNNIEIKNLNSISNQIKFFDLNKLKYDKKYDFILIIDVLHHIGVDNKIIKILNLMKFQYKYLFIKDHFEYGFFSNKILRIMDFIGNYYNNVSIPRKYFTQIQYDKLINKANLNEIKRITNIRYYKKYWLFFSSPKLQFLSIIKNK